MAARANLAFLGQEDIVLSGDPEVSYFVEKYKGQTHFSSRVDQVEFDNNAIVFGTESQVVLPRSGDLVTEMYFKINFPNIGASSVVDSVGTLMIHYFELYIGSQLIERIYGEYIEMSFDLEIPKGKQGALNGLIGKRLQAPYIYAPYSSYTIPLQFSCLKKGLAICAMDEDVLVRIVFNPSAMFTQPPITFTDNVNAYLDVEYTYLPQTEIDFIKSRPRLALINQVQRAEYFAQQGVVTASCFMNFVNPVKELFFVIQNDNAIGYDYSNVASGTTDQLNTLSLLFNSTDRISPTVGTPLFLRIVQALEFHTRVPDRLFYMYSFSLDPQGDTPAGSVNLSRINNQILQLTLNPSTTNRYIRVYAVSHNFMLTENGETTVLFPNSGN